MSMRRLAPAWTAAFITVILGSRAFCAGAERIALAPLRVPNAQAATVEFVRPDGAGDAVTLAFRCRADLPDTGFSHDLRLFVNGSIVNGYADRRTPRLLNKTSFRFTYPKYGPYAWCNTNEGWALIRGTSFEAADALVKIYGPDPFRYEVDISDLVAPGVNTVRFECRNFRAKTLDMVVEDAAITFDATRKTARDAPKPLVVSAETRWVPEPAADGAVMLSTEGKTFRFVSAFVNPCGAMAFTGRAGAVVQDGDAGRWENEGLRVRRTLRREGDWLVICDVLESLRGEQGVICRYRLSSDDGPFTEARLCGNPYAEVVAVSEPGNPTVYAARAGLGAGLAVEDDVFRLQSSFKYLEKTGAAEVEDRLLVVSEGRPFTVQLALHLPAAADYWAFVNALRARWSVPTVESPLYCVFVYPESFETATDEALRRYFDKAGIGAVVTGSGITIPDRPNERSILGLGIGHPLTAERRAGWRQLRDRLKRVAPDVEFLLKVHSYFNTPSYADTLERYADAAAKKADGEKVKHPQYGYVFLPTLENSFGQEWLRVVNAVAEEVGADGFYWDESTAPGLPESEMAAPPRAYGLWDGVTADLDGQGRVLRKAALVARLTTAFRTTAIREQRERGRVWCLGGEPQSAAMNALPVNWWRECQWHAAYAFSGHLGPAQGYVSGGATFEHFRELLACGGMPCTLAVNKVSPFLRELFPFATVELGEGWIRGTQKLVAIRSGVFPWPQPGQKVRVLTFVADGEPRVTEAVASPEGRVRVDVPESGIVIVKP